MNTRSTKDRSPKLSQAEQSKRFIDKARELDCDESDDALERALRKVAKPTKSKSKDR
jgi:hypothetical protein